MIRTSTLGVLSFLAVGALLPVQAQTATEVYPTVSGTRVLEDFGGLDGIRALMEEFERELIANPTTQPFFGNRDNTALKARLVEQVCQILNGGCVYTGRTMRESHAGMGVNQAQFYALVEALQAAMEQRRIPFASQNRLLAVLAPMHRDIITR
ncbi:group I truncated hemoglobin [Falsiroseomonas sp. HC035]|uniref:group I truncated hemoglobin n=1 Tax=Falsiroseomonas sp. HC035 TaxID=3390999 RepID=UPI003D31E68E